jgi:hypothetical protein
VCGFAELLENLLKKELTFASSKPIGDDPNESVGSLVSRRKNLPCFIYQTIGDPI